MTKLLMRRIAMAAAVLLGICGSAKAQAHVAPVIGPADARAHLELFLDFTDEASGRLAVVVDALRARHANDVQVTFRHLPPANDHVAALPHRAAMAAERQQRFWDMARVLFANQGQHGRDDLLGMARQLGLDIDRFTADLDDPAADDVLAEDRSRASAVKADHAPVVRLNGATVTGDHTLKRFEALVAAAPAATPSGTH